MKRRRKPLPKAPPVGSLGDEDIFGSLVKATKPGARGTARLDY